MKIKVQHAIPLISEIKAFAKNDPEILKKRRRLRALSIIVGVISITATIISLMSFKRNWILSSVGLVGAFICAMVTVFAFAKDYLSEKAEEYVNQVSAKSADENVDVSNFNYSAKIRKYHLITSVTYICLLLIIISTIFVPYVTILGEKVSIYKCMKDYEFLIGSKEEMAVSEYNYLHGYIAGWDQFFHSNSADHKLQFVSFLGIGRYCILAIIVFFLVAEIIVPFFKIRPITNDVEIELKIRGIPSKFDKTFSGIPLVFFVTVLYFSSLIDFYRYLKKLGGGMDWGKLYSVSPFILILPMFFAIAYMVVSIILSVMLKKDKEMQHALLYSKKYCIAGTTAIE